MEKYLVYETVKRYIYGYEWLLGLQGRAESARAVTGRRCPGSGVGEDVLDVDRFFFYEKGYNSEAKSRKIDLKVRNREIDRLAEGNKQAIEEIWGSIAKTGF